MFKNLFKPFGSKKKQVPRNSNSRRGSEWTPHQQGVTPEQLCEIDPDTMTREAIRQRLAVLYKRHNEAVSSLNPDLREEAAQMLDAIVECRERYVELD